MKYLANYHQYLFLVLYSPNPNQNLPNDKQNYHLVDNLTGLVEVSFSSLLGMTSEIRPGIFGVNIGGNSEARVGLGSLHPTLTYILPN